MKKILLTLALLLSVQLVHAQFVVSAQLGGAFSQGHSSFESRYDGPSPLTGQDTSIIDTGSYSPNKPISFSIGAKIVLCFLMLLGHLGPMTFFQLFQNNLDKKASVHYSFVEEDFLIG